MNYHLTKKEHNQMTFEEVLPQIKAGKKAVRKGWSGFELFI